MPAPQQAEPTVAIDRSREVQDEHEATVDERVPCEVVRDLLEMGERALAAPLPFLIALRTVG